jgi:hypothetical protein
MQQVIVSLLKVLSILISRAGDRISEPSAE